MQAAEQAGLSQLTLLEEPQAALYAWLAAHADTWQTQLKPGSVIFVCDVGGGTTDLSLITVTQGKSQLGLERIAVGDHLLLGGDNMDVALARRVEARISTGKRLDTQRWHLLCQLCRMAKEDLFADALQEKAMLTLPGRGSSVIGGTLTDSLSRQDVEQVVLDGFSPALKPLRGRVGEDRLDSTSRDSTKLASKSSDFLTKRSLKFYATSPFFSAGMSTMSHPRRTD